MAIRCCRILLFVLVAVIGLSASMPTFTLYPAVDPVTKHYDEGKSLFSFKRGATKDITRSTKDWDLSYGGWIINDEDWFGLHFGPETRSVIQDLGKLDWDDTYSIPVLEPRPLVEKGKKWQPTVVVTNDPHGAWTRSGEYAKVILGHMYLLHVKDETADFYVTFHVDDFQQHRWCTISWRIVPTPEPPEESQH